MRSFSARLSRSFSSGRSRSLDGFSHQTLAAIPVAVRKLRPLAPAHFMTSFVGGFDRLFSAIHIVQRIDVETAKPKIGIGRSGHQLGCLLEFRARVAEKFAVAAAGSTNSAQMAFGEVELAADIAVVGSISSALARTSCAWIHSFSVTLGASDLAVLVDDVSAVEISLRLNRVPRARTSTQGTKLVFCKAFVALPGRIHIGETLGFDLARELRSASPRRDFVEHEQQHEDESARDAKNRI